MGDLKRTKSGARSVGWRKKRNHALGRPAAQTRIGEERVHTVRARGGNIKHRALRLNSGTFAWASENATRKTKILNVVFHAADNEFVRTNALNKGSVVSIDAAPFKLWWERVHGAPLGKSTYTRPEKVTDKMTKNWEQYGQDLEVEKDLISQFDQGRVFAIITSRPGQCGRADGYILEGEELAFYQQAIGKKKSK